jgi:hypothetical protein
MMLSISNIYGHGLDAYQLSQLEALGFRIRPQASRYMGAQLCRFIDFERGPSLELIEVEDNQAYMDFIPDGMVPYCPGISLALPLAETMKAYEDEFHHLRPYKLHVNYDGSPGSLGPGWNYLNFGTPVVRDTFIWLTAYDEPRPVKQHVSSHPNTVKGIEGIVFDLHSDGLKTLRQMVKGELAQGMFEIGGLKVWTGDSLDGSLKGQDKDFPLIAVVLKAENLDTFAALTGQVRDCAFLSQPAVQIATNRRSWDLVVIAKSDFGG